MKNNLSNQYRDYFRVVEKKCRKNQIKKCRNILMENLKKKMENLKMNEESALEKIINKKDFDNYLIKTIPKGEHCKIIYQNPILIIKKNGKTIKKVKINKLPNFVARAIYNKKNSIYYITNFDSLKNYNYKNLSEKVKEYLLKNHFKNSKILFKNENFQLVRVISLNFKLSLFNSILKKSENFFCLKLISKNNEKNNYIFYNQKYFNEKKLKIFVKFQNGFFYFLNQIQFFKTENFSDFKENCNYMLELSYKDIQIFKDFLDFKKNEINNFGFIEEVNFDFKKINVVGEIFKKESDLENLYHKVYAIANSNIF